MAAGLYLLGVLFSPIIGVFVTFFLFKNADIQGDEIGALMCLGSIIFTMAAVVIPFLFMN